jgi:Spy/CpxP family protein refolding chaperone
MGSHRLEHRRSTPVPEDESMKRVFSLNRIVLAASMLASVGIIGCASGQPTLSDEDEVAEEGAALEDSADAEGADAEDAADEGATAEERRDRRGRPGRGHGMRGHGPGMGGPAMFLFRAAEDLELTDAQKATLSEIRDGMKPADGERGPRPEKTAELAAAVRKGSVNVATLAPSDADPMKEHRAKMVAAVQKLHDTLTPAQRAELVADLQAKVAEHAGDEPGKGRKGGPKGGEARGPHGKKALFILHGLDVSDEQTAKITAALDEAGLGASDAPEPPDFDVMRAKADAALVAFAKDDFVAANALPDAPAGKMGHGPKRFVESLAVIVPHLDAEQREALAQRIEEGPMGHHGRKGPRGRK